MPLPSIFEFSDHKAYLAEWFQARKESNPKFSYGMFAQEAGLGNRGALLRVTQGKLTFSQTLLSKFIIGLNLNEEEAEHLSLLARIDQLERERARQHNRVQTARDEVVEVRRAGRVVGRQLTNRLRAHEEALQELAEQLSRAHAKLRVLKLLHGPSTLTEGDQTVLKAWHYSAISELSRCQGFERDPAHIQAALIPPLSVEQAQRALDELGPRGLLADASEPEAPKRPDVMSTEVDVRIRDVEQYYRGMSELAQGSLERLLDPSEQTYNERCRIGMLTVAAPRSALGQLQGLLEAFREQVHDALEHAGGAPEEVMQVYFHLFPLTDMEALQRGGRAPTP